MRRCYTNWKPQAEAQSVIAEAASICANYAAQGYDLTLRQLYYQFVARDLLPNRQESYSRLGQIINKARLAGLLDWSYIVDRTRNLSSLSHWEDPAAIMASAAGSFALDKWASQPTRIEVWVEKEALAGVIGQAANRLDVAWFSCRGYVSQSELWAAGRRLKGYIANGQNVIVLHLGDHDPSGIDMTRDINDRLDLFIETDWLYEEMPTVGSAKVSEIRNDMIVRCNGRLPLEVRRIALNMDQVEEYDPPPNPAKLTDSRVGNYLAAFGNESWELDALEPQVLDALISDAIEEAQDVDAWNEVVATEERHVDLLTSVGQRWTDVVAFIDNGRAE